MQLTIQDISKKFDQKTDALSRIAFTMGDNEFVSIIGPSGSGKTTLFRILNGGLIPDSGTVSFSGEVLHSSRSVTKSIQKKIGTIYQDFCLVEQVSCLQNVLNACLPDMHLLSASFGLFTHAQKEEASALLARVGLGDKIDEPVKTLSGGQKQRVAIARALMRHPTLLLADEPVASLDPVTGRQILELLQSIVQQDHIAILMNSHNVAFSLEYSTRIIGLRSGRIVLDCPASEASEDALMTVYDQCEGDRHVQ